MHLHCEDCGNAVLMTVTATRFDAVTSEAIGEAARDVFRSDRHVYLMNLEHVVHIDSTGIGTLVGLFKQLGRTGRLELCALMPSVLKVFHLTHLDAVFTMHSDADTGLFAHATHRRPASG